jgi:uncharacterized membrane protein YqhA
MTQKPLDAPHASQSELSPLLKLIIRTRFLSSIAVISSLVATLLMLLIGTENTIHALMTFFFRDLETVGALDTGEEATLLLLEALDNFLVGLAFLYFAYGIYALFITLDQNVLSFLPQWLQVSSISTLKKSLMEVLVVLLSVIFVKGLLEELSTGIVHWEFLVIPISIVAIALSLKLMDLDES